MSANVIAVISAKNSSSGATNGDVIAAAVQ